MKAIKSSTIGCDKVWLNTKPNGIKLLCDQSKLINLSDGWYKSNAGVQVDNDFVQVAARFKTKKSNEGNLFLDVDLLNQSAKIQFNPSRFDSDYGLNKDLSLTFERVFDVAQSVGVLIDLDACNLTRFDVAVDGVLSENPSIYADHLRRHLNFAHCGKNEKRTYPDGHTLGNRSIQIGYYNRKKKVEQDKITNDLHPNTGRNEVRLLSGGHRSWNNTEFGCDIRNVINVSEDHLWSIYHNQCTRLIKAKDYNLSGQVRTLMDKMAYFHTNSGSRWFQMMMLHDGISLLLSEFSVDDIIDIATDIDESKNPRKFKAYLKNVIGQQIEFERIKKTFGKRESMSYVDEWMSVFVA